MANSTEAVVKAIHTGDVHTLQRLLDEEPELVKARFDGQRTLLHVATDWPGHFPNSAAIVAALIERGADVNAPFIGSHSETPLHWAASSDDVDVLDLLLDNGADIEAPGSVIGGGTALADAVAFGQWKCARRLIEWGAQANLWQAAGLGLLDRVEKLFAGDPAPSPAEVTNAFWLSCHGSQLETAQHLFSRGADINWIGFDKLTPLDAALRSRADDVVNWLRAIGARSAADS